MSGLGVGAIELQRANQDSEAPWLLIGGFQIQGPMARRGAWPGPAKAVKFISKYKLLGVMKA